MRLQQRVAIITGGATGIGEAISARLAEEGAGVVVADVQADAAQRVVNALAARGLRALSIPTDVTSDPQIQVCVEETLRAFGRLDILVNNAGINFVRPTLEVTLEDWDRVIGVDLRGTFSFCQHALRVMVKQRSGSIINISSVHARATLAGATLYAAAKGGVSAMTRALAIEFGTYGIRVNAVCPGLTATKIWDDLVAIAPAPADLERWWRQHIALDRIQDPLEVANVVLFLASTESSYITGAELYTDGGMTAMLTRRDEPAPSFDPVQPMS